VTLSSETDAQGQSIEECVTFSGGQTWGPVALADVYMAGEIASKVPVQILDDAGTSATPPPSCGALGTQINGVSGFAANGVLGIGVLVQDCGAACVSAAAPAPLPAYYGCTTAGVCTPEGIALVNQVTNPVTMFATDNNGVVISFPHLVNANGDATIQGQLLFGIATQADNALSATSLTVLGADSNGDFRASYNGSPTALLARIDSGSEAYAFYDPTIPPCASGLFSGYYCPTTPPQSVSVVNNGVGTNNSSATVNFAIADPGSFVAGAAAVDGLAGGANSAKLFWGMPFFYGRKIYFGIDQRVSGPYTGPYYAY
jgi:hypothetical protein